VTTHETSVKVAVVQAGSVPFDADACVDKALWLIADAAATGAKVIVFPEAFIVGYPKGLGYGLVVGARDAAGREEFRIYLEAAIKVPGPHTQRLGEAAAAHGCYVVIGVIEREAGTCYCTVLFFGPDGRLLGKHRKLMPTALERMIWGFGDGSTLTAVESPYGNIGSVICWENYMPMPDTVRVSLGDSPDSVLMRGGSAIISPLGKVLAGPHFGSETILTATLDLGEISRGKFDFDVVGHYSRPDVFQLRVNEEPMRAVVAKKDE